MSGANKVFSSLLAVSISLVAIAPPISQPIQAQTQDALERELLKLIQQAVQQEQQEQPVRTYPTAKKRVSGIGRLILDEELVLTPLLSL